MLFAYKRYFPEKYKCDFVVYPNGKENKSSNDSECVITEKCIVEEAHKIVMKRHKREEEYLFMEANMRV